MQKKYLTKYVLITCFMIFMSTPVLALEYFSYQMNFPSGESRDHLQIITYTGSSLEVTVPQNFTLVSYSFGGTVFGNNISWSSGTNKTINYTIKSPSNCIEGDIYYSNIWLNNSYYSRFVFACISDNKIVDYKLEYGHGDANYLAQDYISNETTTLFNLIRVFNIGHYLEGDEAAYDAQINCTFEKYPVRTYGRVEVEYFNNYINGNFLWDIIESGYWFRIGVFSQDVSGKSIGDFYRIKCSDLIYSFTHERVRASFINKSIEIRSTKPFQISVLEHEDKLSYTIQNTEKYTAENSIIEWNLEGEIKRESFGDLHPGEIIKYDIYLEGNSTLNLIIDFIPSWYANSRNPKIYTQTHSYSYNLTDNPAQIIDARYVLLKKINETVTNTRESQQANFRVELSDLGEIAAGKDYRAKLWVYNFEGKPRNATTTPIITLYDSLRNIIVQNVEMQFLDIGIYEYSFTTSSTHTSGMWESIVSANISGVIVKPSDYWEFESSPAEVTINSICDKTIPTIAADVTITNEGSGAQEYHYEYCIVTEQSNSCGGSDDECYGSGARNLQPGQSWNSIEEEPNRFTCDEITQTGDYWFKVLVYYGTEVSGASKLFTATEAPAEEPSVPSGGGGTPSVTYDEQTVGALAAGSTKAITFTKSATLAVTEITVNVKNKVTNAKIKVDSGSLPSGASKPSTKGSVYKYIEITKTGMADDDVSKAIIKFKVKKEWLTNKGYGKDTIALHRYYGNNWNKLTTTRDSGDTTYYYYSAESPGFSTFAITAEKAPVVTVPAEEPEEEPIFDIKVEIPAKFIEVIAGEGLLSEIILYNPKGVRLEDVEVEYTIKDMNGEVIAKEHETVAVETRTSFIKDFTIPSFVETGSYILYVKVTYNGLVASSSSLFNVVEKPHVEIPAQTEKYYYVLYIVIGIIVIFVILMFYQYMKLKELTKLVKKVTTDDLIKTKKIKYKGGE